MVMRPENMTLKQRRLRRYQMALAVENGRGVKEVAAEHGVSVPLVYQSCREAGIASSRNGKPEPAAHDHLHSAAKDMMDALDALNIHQAWLPIEERIPRELHKQIIAALCKAKGQTWNPDGE